MPQELCSKIHEKNILIDDERYNLERKAKMVVDEVSFLLFFSLNQLAIILMLLRHNQSHAH